MLIIKAPKAPKFKVGGRIKITKYKNIFSKGYTKNWSGEIFVISSALLVISYKAKRFAFPGFFHLVLIFYFLNISEFGAKKYFTTYQTANTIQLFFAIKGNLFGLFFY